jgi:hypothetical protein
VDSKCVAAMVSFCPDVCDGNLRLGFVREIITDGSQVDLACLQEIAGLKVSIFVLLNSHDI